MNQPPYYRRRRAAISEFSIMQIHLRNPWIPAFFSFSFPGFGNLMQHRLLKAFILIGWEIFINTKAKINLGILYSLLGQFEKAKNVLDERWLILYIGIYMYGIWDSYRTTVDMNKQYLLADREDAPLIPNKMSTLDFNYFDKREPRTALLWSLIAPGLGHLYVHKVITGLFLFGFSVFIVYFSHLAQVFTYTFIGQFDRALNVIDMQWALYLPSIYIFILYDSYVSAIEYNKLFEKELSYYLRKNFQYQDFKFPI
jgi:hypothetical protein